MPQPMTLKQAGAFLAVDELTPFPGNAKRGDVDVILASLRRNGQYKALTVRDEGDGRLVVLTGNHTSQAIAKHGPGDCSTQGCGLCGNEPSWQPAARVDIVDCDDQTATAINIADNRLSDVGGYDYEALSDLLGSLETLDGTGYTESDVQLLIAPPPSLDELADSHGDPEADDFWPVLKFRIAPETRDAFYHLTLNCPNPNDDAERFRYLIERASTTPETTA